MKLLALMFCSLFLAACEPFGSPHEEIGKSFSEDSFKRITEATGVNFSAPVERICFYDTAGRDPGMFAKLVIPNATAEEFRDLNLDFDDWKITDDPFSPSTLRDWWKPGELNRAMHLQKYFDDHQDCSDVSWGFEGDSLVVYVSWFTT